MGKVQFFVIYSCCDEDVDISRGGKDSIAYGKITDLMRWFLISYIETNC